MTCNLFKYNNTHRHLSSMRGCWRAVQTVFSQPRTWRPSTIVWPSSEYLAGDQWPWRCGASH